jgi:hypothetical protein
VKRPFYPKNLVKPLFSYYYFFAKRFQHAKGLSKWYAAIKHFIEIDDESLCHLLKRIELQTYIGGGQLTFLQFLMLCDILASQKQCSIKCLGSLQPVQKDFLNMVQAMPSPSKIHIEMWRIFFFFFGFVRNFAQITMAGGGYSKHRCWQTGPNYHCST